MSEEKVLEKLGKSIEDLMPKITALDKTLAVTNTNMTHLTKEVTSIANENSKMRGTVYGNGNPEGGLSGRMTVVERVVEKWKETQTWIVRLMIGGIVLGVIGAAINYFL